MKRLKAHIETTWLWIQSAEGNGVYYLFFLVALILCEIAKEKAVLDQGLWDVMLQHRSRVSIDTPIYPERVVLMELTDTLWEIGNHEQRNFRDTPPPLPGSSRHFPRQTLAKVITELAKFKPRVVVVDMVLSTPTFPEADEELRQAIAANAERLVFAQEVVWTGNRYTFAEPSPLFRNLGATFAPAFAVTDEPGNLIRHVQLRCEVDGEERSTLPVVVLEKLGHGTTLPKGKKVHLGLPAPNVHLVADGLIESTLARENAARLIDSNSVVVVGDFGVSSPDRALVPRWLNPASNIRGSELVAHSIQTLLDLRTDSFPRRMVPFEPSGHFVPWIIYSTISLTGGWYSGKINGENARFGIVRMLFKLGAVWPFVIALVLEVISWGCLLRIPIIEMVMFVLIGNHYHNIVNHHNPHMTVYAEADPKSGTE